MSPPRHVCHGRTQPPAVSPNHVAILSADADGCPASPPRPACARQFIGPSELNEDINVVVLDSGFIMANGAAAELNPRVRSVPGVWLDSTTGTWEFDPPDGLYTDANGALDEITGHGTFIAGLIARICPEATITVVGLRDQEVLIAPLDPDEQSFLFSTEAAITYSMLLYCDTDVIQCGFSFPTLDDYPSIPFTNVMEVLTERRRSASGSRSRRARRQRGLTQALLAGGAARRDRRRGHQPSDEAPRALL